MKLLYVSLLPLFLLFLSLPAFGQQRTIIYNYSQGVFKKAISPVPEGEFVTFKIINVNTFRFKVEIKGVNIDFVTQVPSELQTLFRLPDQSINNATTTDGLKEAEEATNLMKSLLDITTEETKKAVKDAEEAKTAKETAISKAKKAETEKKAEAAAEEEENKKKLEKALEDLTQTCDEYIIIAQKVANIKFIRVELINVSKHDWENYAKLAARLPPLQSRNSMKKDYDDFITAYAKAYSLYARAQSAAKDANDTDKQEEIAEAEEKLEEANGKISADNFLKLIEDVMVLQEALQNEKYFEVKSAPIQMDGDFMEFTVKTTPVQTNDLMPFAGAQEFPVIIPAQGGLKVDFSVGPIISFGPNSKDDKYYFQESNQDTTLLKLDNKNAISPSLAAMMHFYGRSGKTGSIGGLFGVGAGFQSINDVNLSLVAGLSAVLGKREKIMLNTGVSYLRVKRLKTNQYRENGVYLPSKLSINDVTEKAFKPSFFLSISYNLTTRVQRN